MKNIYMTPSVELEVVEVKDVITSSLINGGEDGGVYGTVDLGGLFI